MKSDGSNSKKSGLKIKFDSGIVKFLSLFIFLITVFYFLSAKFEPFIPLFNQKSTTNTLFFIIQTLKIQATIDKNIINFPGFSFIIVGQCTGIFELIALSSCMLAYPTRLKYKLFGIFAIIPIIYSLNMLRLIFLSFIGVYAYQLFDIIHKYIFQLTFVSLVIMLWMIWIDVVRRNERRN